LELEVPSLDISYNKLWKLLIDKGMNKTQLGEASGISSSTISKMGKNEQISMDSMLKICKVLDCDIGDIVEIKESGKGTRKDEELEDEQQQGM
jgi:DNA (cytosine-5)-methyltransferase 1